MLARHWSEQEQSYGLTAPEWGPTGGYFFMGLHSGPMGAKQNKNDDSS